MRRWRSSRSGWHVDYVVVRNQRAVIAARSQDKALSYWVPPSWATRLIDNLEVQAP